MPRHIRSLAAAAVFIAIYVFWLHSHPEALSFREQYQMFLFSWDYLLEHLLIAGGMAEYIGEFLMQFCYYPAIGAALVTLPFLLLLVGISLTGSRMGGKGHYVLSLLPILLMLAYMGDENVKVTFLVSMTASVLAALPYAGMEGARCRVVTRLVAVPATYWLCGPGGAMVYTLVCLSADWRRGRWADGAWPVAYLAGLVTASGFTLMSQYTPVDILFGQNYHNLRMSVPAMQFVVEAACALTPVAIASLPSVRSRWAVWAEAGAIAAGGCALIAFSFGSDKYDAIEFDYLVRREKWDRIIEKAETDRAKDPVSLTSLNLALAMRGQLCDRMFEFSQMGSEGLLAPSRRNQFSSLPTAEALFRLGMVNEAQRYFFDLQESILDCRKSGRLSKRVAETLIINGKYEMARKYLSRLKETLFYSEWAKKAENALGNESAINAHPTWGRIRRLRYSQSFFGNYNEMDKMLGILFMENAENKMALDYYLAQCMLKRDLKQLWAGLGWIRQTYGDKPPRHVQEAVAMTWAQGHTSFDGVPLPLSREVTSDFTEFARLYSAGSSNPQLNTDKWRKTYWHYLLSAKPDAHTGATDSAIQEATR